MQNTDITVTADAVIAEWANNLSRREGHMPEMDAENFEARRQYYARDLGFDQYQSLNAYLECYGLGKLTFADADEELKAWQGTFGLNEEDQSREALKGVLDDHFQAMSKAYNAELAAFVEDMRL